MVKLKFWVFSMNLFRAPEAILRHQHRVNEHPASQTIKTRQSQIPESELSGSRGDGYEHDRRKPAPWTLVETAQRFRGASLWWWTQQASLRHRSISAKLHGATKQKIVVCKCMCIYMAASSTQGKFVYLQELKSYRNLFLSNRPS